MAWLWPIKDPSSISQKKIRKSVFSRVWVIYRAQNKQAVVKLFWILPQKRAAMAATAQNHMEPLRSDGKKEEDFEEERELEMIQMDGSNLLRRQRIYSVCQLDTV